MDNETRPKKRPASQDTLPDTERAAGSSAKKRRTSDGATKRRRSSAETQSAGRSSASSSGSPKRRRASTEPLSESRSSADGQARKRRANAEPLSGDISSADSQARKSRSRNRIPLPTESTDPEFDQERRDRARRRKKAQMRRRREYRKRLIIIAACAAAFILLCVGIVRLVKGRKSANAAQPETTQTAIADTITTESTLAAESSVSAAAVPASTVKPTPDYEEISFEPHSTDATDPSNMFDYTGVNIDGQDIEDRDSHVPFFNGEFGVPSAYTDVDGIVGFRGNNFRDDPTYGSTVSSVSAATISATTPLTVQSIRSRVPWKLPGQDRRARWIQQVIPGAATAGPASLS